MTGPIKHILVLMLENRSFDHLLAYSEIPGLEGVDPSMTNPAPDGGSVAMSCTAPDVLSEDPGHEFEDVDWQLYRAPRGDAVPPRPITLAGFVDRAGSQAMQCVPSSLVPALTTLGRQFVVCDHWFSSMPGPTWPNRFFAHAASSGGLANSPSGFESTTAMLWSELGFSFQNGTLFDRIDQAAQASGPLSWRVYHGDYFPQVCAIDTMPATFVADPDKFRALKNLAADLAQGDAASYTFIEPDYGILSEFKDGNSQHPVGSLSAGESLIRTVYGALSSSPVWNESLLLIVYDEHGGFYDQLPPPAGVPPGDEASNADKAQHPPSPPFAFDRLGVRVPAIVVSPWIQGGSVSHDEFDHASIVRTVFDLLGLPGRLTNRDGHANSLRGLLQASPRTGPAPPLPGSDCSPAAVSPASAGSGKLPASLAGYTRVAAQIHLALNHYQAPMTPGELHSMLRNAIADPVQLPLPQTDAPEECLAYLKQVSTLIDAHRIRQGRGAIK